MPDIGSSIIHSIIHISNSRPILHHPLPSPFRIPHPDPANYHHIHAPHPCIDKLSCSISIFFYHPFPSRSPGHIQNLIPNPPLPQLLPAHSLLRPNPPPRPLRLPLLRQLRLRNPVLLGQNLPPRSLRRSSNLTFPSHLPR